jgi:tetratricopeptide (TPR) repeat protein
VRYRYLLTLLGLAVLAAQPPAADDVDARLRAAQAALLKGDDAEAGRLYEGTTERSRDPGLIAFNLATIHFRKGEFREAELQFNCALEDAEAPPARRARALYNRAVSQLRRGGLPQYRSAIEGFERCLVSDGIDPDLARDAEHNLELAKLLWLESRAKVSAPPKPNEVLPDQTPEPKPPKPQAGTEKPADPGGTDPNGRPKPGVIDPLRAPIRPSAAAATCP